MFRSLLSVVRYLCVPVLLVIVGVLAYLYQDADERRGKMTALYVQHRALADNLKAENDRLRREQTATARKAHVDLKDAADELDKVRERISTLEKCVSKEVDELAARRRYLLDLLYPAASVAASK
jgi:hypothetical protein